MTARAALAVLFSEVQIRGRVAELARSIAELHDKPDLAMAVLVGGFVFAADLLRALDQCSVALAVDFLRLTSYGTAQVAEGGTRILMTADENVAGRHVLLLDGVVDRGHTLAAARELVRKANARKVTTAVVIDKCRADASVRADFAAFTHVEHFVVGYGMDDGGCFRSLPYIAAAG